MLVLLVEGSEDGNAESIAGGAGSSLGGLLGDGTILGSGTSTGGVEPADWRVEYAAT